MFRVSAISTLVLLLLIVGSVVAILAERKFKLQSPVHVPATQNECLDVRHFLSLNLNIRDMLVYF
jgi:hypothetical protein